MNSHEQISADKQLLESLGGPLGVCKLLGLDKSSGGLQRVHNWMSRGIPSKVKVDRPDIFMVSARSESPP